MVVGVGINVRDWGEGVWANADKGQSGGGGGGLIRVGLDCEQAVSNVEMLQVDFNGLCFTNIIDYNDNFVVKYCNNNGL